MSEKHSLKDFHKTKEIPMTIDIQSEESRKKILTQLSQLRSHAGWKLLTHDIETLIKQTESDIFTLGSNKVEFSGKDLMIIMRNFMQQVLDRPDQIRMALVGSEESESEDYDPYA